jgi:hypothetical protein
MRILEKLIDERMCFWIMLYSKGQLFDAAKRLHGEMWDNYSMSSF